MKKHIIILFYLYCTAAQLQGYNSIWLKDLKNDWYSSSGTIEEATLSIRPKGLFIEYGLYLTFSASLTKWTSTTDSLRLNLAFSLPENAIVTDSWLYMDDYIAKAKIIDERIASPISEGIKTRIEDPLVLRKISSTQYDLEIFPLIGTKTRKVKITCLIPADLHSNKATSELPFVLLSALPPKQGVEVLVWTNDNLSNPSLSFNPPAFSLENDSVLGNYYKTTIPQLRYGSKIFFDLSLNNGISVSKHSINEYSGFYHLALFPELVIDSLENKKALILIDYEDDNTYVSSYELLTTLESKLLKTLSPSDSFNLMVSNLSVKSYSDKWEQATAENIKSAFSKLSSSLSKYSNLSSLLVSGIEFVKNNGHEGSIVLLSNSNQYLEYDVQTKITNDIISLLEPRIEFHITGYQSKNIQYIHLNGEVYTGNGIIYSTLSENTSGSLHQVGVGVSLSDAISATLLNLSATINSFDLQTITSEGYCQDIYNLTESKSSILVSDPIQQVGKYIGNSPFSVEISGEYIGKNISKNIELTNDNIIDSDDIVAKIWAGRHILTLEKQEQNHSIKDEIIFSSISNSILSKYTSFLCLEHNDYVCNDCIDESELTSLTQLSQNDTIKVYPNPFNDVLNIKLTLSSGEEVSDLSLVDLSGRIIHKFNTNTLILGKNHITLNSSDINSVALKQGLYILNYTTNKSKYSIKTIKK